MLAKRTPYFIILIIFFTALNHSSAQFFARWSGNISSDWHTPGNWQDGLVPSFVTDVQIDPAGVTHYPVIFSAAHAKSVLIFGGTFTIFNEASLTLAGPASIYNGYSTEFYVLGGSVMNNGTLNIGLSLTSSGSRPLWIHSAASFTNSLTGTIKIGSSQDIGIACFGSFINDGNIDIGASSSPNMKTGLVHQGTNFNNRATGHIKINRSSVNAISISGGTLSNIGSMDIGDDYSSGDIGIIIGTLGEFSNSGPLSIEKISMRGIENNGIVSNNSTIDFNLGVVEFELANNGYFTNQVGSELTFRSTNADYNLFNYSDGTIVNSGIINIGQTLSTEKGLSNSGTFTNSASGSIKVDRTAEFGLVNSGTFFNYGSMHFGNISSTGATAFVNTGYFTHEGSLQVNRSPDRAINNNSGATFNAIGGTIKIGNLTNSSDFGIVNNGEFNISDMTLEVNKATTRGIYNTPSGVFNIKSNGVAKVGNNSLSAPVAVANEGSFGVYGSGAILEINNSSEIGLFNSGIFINTGSFGNTNGATLKIGNLAAVGQNGIGNTGTFKNDYTGSRIEINRVSVNAINNNGGIFENKNNAVIDIGTSGNNFSQGISNSNGTFSNGLNSTITLNRFSDTGIDNNSTFIVNGTIKVENNVSTAQYGIINDGPFSILGSGKVFIEYTSINGIRNQSGNFINEGKIELGVVSAIGPYGIYNYATFENKSGGEIVINRASTNGIYNSSTFSTAGEIEIGNVGAIIPTGINNRASGTFSVQALGVTQLNRCDDYGVMNLGTLNVANSGTLILGNSVNGGIVGFHNMGTFNQSGTTKIDRNSIIGLINEGVVKNASVMEIGLAFTQGFTGIQNKNYFENTTTSSTITIGPKLIDGILNETSSGNFIIKGNVTVLPQ